MVMGEPLAVNRLRVAQLDIQGGYRPARADQQIVGLEELQHAGIERGAPVLGLGGGNCPSCPTLAVRHTRQDRLNWLVLRRSRFARPTIPIP